MNHELTRGGRVGHAIPASGVRLPAVSDESESRALQNNISYFLRRRMRTSKLTTPFWSRALHLVGRHRAVGEERHHSVHPLNRPSGPPPLLPLQSGPRRHQGIL